jgi:hypothetical protein
VRRRKPAPVCAAAGCCERIESWQRLCGRCWRKIPFDLREKIKAAMAARAPHLVVDHIRDAVRWLAEHSPAAAIARLTGERDV